MRRFNTVSFPQTTKQRFSYFCDWVDKFIHTEDSERDYASYRIKTILAEIAFLDNSVRVLCNEDSGLPAVLNIRCFTFPCIAITINNESDSAANDGEMWRKLSLLPLLKLVADKKNRNDTRILVNLLTPDVILSENDITIPLVQAEKAIFISKENAKWILNQVDWLKTDNKGKVILQGYEDWTKRYLDVRDAIAEIKKHISSDEGFRPEVYSALVLALVLKLTFCMVTEDNVRVAVDKDALKKDILREHITPIVFRNSETQKRLIEVSLTPYSLTDKQESEEIAYTQMSLISAFEFYMKNPSIDLFKIHVEDLKEDFYYTFDRNDAEVLFKSLNLLLESYGLPLIEKVPTAKERRISEFLELMPRYWASQKAKEKTEIMNKALKYLALLGAMDCDCQIMANKSDGLPTGLNIQAANKYILPVMVCNHTMDSTNLGQGRVYRRYSLLSVLQYYLNNIGTKSGFDSIVINILLSEDGSNALEIDKPKAEYILNLAAQFKQQLVN